MTSLHRSLRSARRQHVRSATSSRRGTSVAAWILLALLYVWTFISVGPLVWMLGNSFRTTADIFNAPVGLPDFSKASNYVEAWVTGDLEQSLFNSLFVTVGAVVLSLVVSVPAGFALSRGRLPFSSAVLTFFLLGLMIPTFSLLLPLLLQFQAAGLVSTRVGLILVYGGFQVSLGVFLFKVAFDAIPKDYIEAGVLDGASVPRLLISVATPMIRPTIGTFVILAFLNSYNDFVFALVLNNDPNLRTLPVAILQFSSVYGTRYDLIFASITIATIPPLIVYLLLRRQIQSSVAMGGRTG